MSHPNSSRRARPHAGGAMTGPGVGGSCCYTTAATAPPQVTVVLARRRAVRSQEHPPIARVVVSRRIPTPPPGYFRSSYSAGNCNPPPGPPGPTPLDLLRKVQALIPPKLTWRRSAPSLRILTQFKDRPAGYPPAYGVPTHGYVMFHQAQAHGR